MFQLTVRCEPATASSPPTGQRVCVGAVEMMSCVCVCVSEGQRPAGLSVPPLSRCRSKLWPARILRSPPHRLPHRCQKPAAAKIAYACVRMAHSSRGKKTQNNLKHCLDPLRAEEGVVESHARSRLSGVIRDRIHFFFSCIRLKLIRQCIFSHVCPFSTFVFLAIIIKTPHSYTYKMNTRPVLD